MKLCDFEVGLDRPLFLMAGPCVVESEQLAMDTAGELKQICQADLPGFKTPIYFQVIF